MFISESPYLIRNIWDMQERLGMESHVDILTISSITTYTVR